MKVRINRGIVDCELVKRNTLTVWVRLLDTAVYGKYLIKRKLSDIVEW